jgi:hypothetical protein
MKRKLSLLFVGVVLLLTNLIAQTDRVASGRAAIENAGQNLKTYFDPLIVIMYIAGAIMGIVGAVKTYSKWQSGDPDTGKTAASWFGGCIFLVLVGVILQNFFLD